MGPLTTTPFAATRAVGVGREPVFSELSENLAVDATLGTLTGRLVTAPSRYPARAPTILTASDDRVGRRAGAMDLPVVGSAGTT